ncbi:MAG: quinone-dependent dihydroorotate dehydrogenase [Anaerolineae bacterium]|nr:quinone-dependent dihydroorotate dehydrogenase [Anaerolineae bacterium]
MYKMLRPLIYKIQPDLAHWMTIQLLRIGGSSKAARTLMQWLFRSKQQGPPVQAFGLKFTNPIGLAAGYDKDGNAWRGLACLGFGHIEIGTVTWRPQPGNPYPRLSRLVEDCAIINRNGFRNRGAAYAKRQLKAPKPAGLVLGVNIGKNKDTPLEKTAQEYLNLFKVFSPLADYLAVNVSSPNTPGLRDLQARQELENLLTPLKISRDEKALIGGKRTPILVKLSPDLCDRQLEEALEAIVRCGMDGVIIGNTTVSRPGLTSNQAGQNGGLSGLPLRDLNTRLVARSVKILGNQLPVVASGGVMSADDAQAKLDAGACLVQLYTGLIYSGPGMVRHCLDANLTLRH